MSGALSHYAAANPAPGSERRSHGRLRQQGVLCNLGVVLDLSAGGMRVLSTKNHEGEMMVRIWTVSEKALVKVGVVWSQRVGFRRYVIGMRFLELSESSATMLG